MDITFDLDNLLSLVNGLKTGLEFNIADILGAIGSGSLGGAPEVPVTP